MSNDPHNMMTKFLAKSLAKRYPRIKDSISTESSEYLNKYAVRVESFEIEHLGRHLILSMNIIIDPDKMEIIAIYSLNNVDDNIYHDGNRIEININDPEMMNKIFKFYDWIQDI